MPLWWSCCCYCCPVFVCWLSVPSLQIGSIENWHSDRTKEPNRWLWLNFGSDHFMQRLKCFNVHSLIVSFASNINRMKSSPFHSEPIPSWMRVNGTWTAHVEFNNKCSWHFCCCCFCVLAVYAFRSVFVSIISDKFRFYLHCVFAARNLNAAIVQSYKRSSEQTAIS